MVWSQPQAYTCTIISELLVLVQFRYNGLYWNLPFLIFVIVGHRRFSMMWQENNKTKRLWCVDTKWQRMMCCFLIFCMVETAVENAILWAIWWWWLHVLMVQQICANMAVSSPQNIAITQAYHSTLLSSQGSKGVNTYRVIKIPSIEQYYKQSYLLNNLLPCYWRVEIPSFRLGREKKMKFAFSIINLESLYSISGFLMSFEYESWFCYGLRHIYDIITVWQFGLTQLTWRDVITPLLLSL